MSSIDDLLQSLVSGAPQPQEVTPAIVDQLRRRQNYAELASMSGDPGLQDFGNKVIGSNQQDIQQLGQQQMQNKVEDLHQQQFQNLMGHQSADLAETIRYHNMENQAREDAIAQRKASQKVVETSQGLIDSIGQYRAPPIQRYSERGIAIMDAVNQQYPQYDATEFPKRKAAQVSFGSGPDSNLMKNADVAVQHLDTADRLASALHNTPYPAVNYFKNAWMTQTGNPAVRQFDAAKQIVSDEINKFVVGGGAALEDRKALQDQLQSSTGYDGIHGVISTLHELMGGQLRGLQTKFVNAGLGDENAFAHRLSPKTVQILGLAPPGGSQGGAVPTPGAGSGAPQGPAPTGPAGAGVPPVAPAPASPYVRTGYDSKTKQRVGMKADGTVVPIGQ